MIKVVGDIQSIEVPLEHRNERFVRFISGLEALIGRIGELHIEEQGWLEAIDLPNQIPGWPFVGDPDERPDELAFRGARANLVLLRGPGGFRLIVRLKDLGFADSLDATPTFIDETLSYVEAVFSPDCVNATIGMRTNSGYAMPLPISNDSQFRAGMTYWKVDRRCPDVLHKQTITSERFQYAATMPLPPNVERSFSAPYLTFRWHWDGDITPETYEIQCGLQHQWYRDALNLNIDSNYNDLGDYRTGTGPRSADPLFTYYEGDLGLGASGVKGMVPEDGVLDPDVLKSFSEMLAAGRTPSGLQLDEVEIIVPSREMAVATYEQARAAGIKAVLYPGKYGMMNPFPEWPGGWLHEVAPGRGYRGVKR